MDNSPNHVFPTEHTNLYKTVESFFGNEPSSLKLLREGLRCSVYRASFPSQSRLSSCIVKQKRAEHEGFHNELSWYQELQKYPQKLSIPSLLGFDATEDILFLEDIGDVPTLDYYLHQQDQEAAKDTLCFVAEELGRLHRKTQELFAQKKLRDGAIIALKKQGKEFFQSRKALFDLLRALEVSVPTGIESELSRISEFFSQPTDFFTFTVGDIAPSNMLLPSSGPVFLDLEFAGYRHAYYDAMLWHSICPFPADVVDSMEEAYREGLRIMHQVEGVEKQAAIMVFHRVLWSLTWNITALLEADQQWLPNATGRALVCTWLASAERVFPLMEADFPSCVAVLSTTKDVLARQWKDVLPVAFSAFSQSE